MCDNYAGKRQKGPGRQKNRRGREKEGEKLKKNDFRESETTTAKGNGRVTMMVVLNGQLFWMGLRNGVGYQGYLWRNMVNSVSVLCQMMSWRSHKIKTRSHKHELIFPDLFL